MSSAFWARLGYLLCPPALYSSQLRWLCCWPQRFSAPLLLPGYAQCHIEATTATTASIPELTQLTKQAVENPSSLPLRRPWLGVRHYINSTGVPRVTAAKPFCAQPQTPGGTMFFDSLDGVHRTTRPKPARGWKQRADTVAINAQESNYELSDLHRWSTLRQCTPKLTKSCFVSIPCVALLAIVTMSSPARICCWRRNDSLTARLIRFRSAALSATRRDTVTPRRPNFRPLLRA